MLLEANRDTLTLPLLHILFFFIVSYGDDVFFSQKLCIVFNSPNNFYINSKLQILIQQVETDPVILARVDGQDHLYNLALFGAEREREREREKLETIDFDNVTNATCNIM
jgi:hypothetical protein